MQDKLLELKQRFADENNVVGERLADALSEYLSSFKSELMANIDDKRFAGKKVNKIVNGLISKKDLQRSMEKHMFPIVDSKEYYMIEAAQNDAEIIKIMNNRGKNQTLNDGAVILLGYAFYMGNYMQLQELLQKQEEGGPHQYKAVLTDKNGEELEASYRISQSPAIVKKVRKIWNLSRMYGDESPVAYVPLAAHFVRFDLDVSGLGENCVIDGIDLQLDFNGLDKYIELNHELVWNVKIEDGGLEVEPVRSPIGEAIHWKYRFSQIRQEQYIIPKRNEWKTFQIQTLANGDVELDFENCTMDKFEKVNIYDNILDTDFPTTKLYKVNYNLDDLHPQSRLRSEADIQYELNKYSDGNGTKITYINIKNKTDRDRKVERFSDYEIYESGRFGYKNKNKVSIRFEDYPDDSFFFDYASFVLSHLTYLYPEIGWEGVF